MIRLRATGEVETDAAPFPFYGPPAPAAPFPFYGPPAPATANPDFVLPVPDAQPDDAAQAIVDRYGIPPAWVPLLISTAANVGADPNDLAALIWHESRFNPRAQYGDVTGKRSFNPRLATGLIQFTPRTAMGLHTTTAALRSMPFEQQWVYVDRYLRMAAEGKLGGGAGPLDTRQRLFMSVFYPAYRNYRADQQFPASVIAQNPGILTPSHYMRLVDHEQERLASAGPDNDGSASRRWSSSPGTRSGGVVLAAVLVLGVLGATLALR